MKMCSSNSARLKHHPMVPALHAALPREDWDSILHSHLLLYLATEVQVLQQSDISINPFIPGSYVQRLQKMSGLWAELQGDRAAKETPWYAGRVLRPWRGSQVAPGTCQAVQSLGSHPGCKGASWAESLWQAAGSHQLCKHQVSILDCPASPTGNIHTAKIQEQHQNPLANAKQIIYLLASSSKRQGKKDVKNMINLTGPKQ